MSANTQIRSMAILAWLILAVTPAALAGDRRACCKPDVDLDELHADLWQDGDGWLIRVRYEIEIEDACQAERFSLTLHAADDGAAICDASGRVAVTEIALDRPVKCSRDEQDYEGVAEIRLPRGAIHCPNRVKIFGAVVGARGACALDSADTKAEFHPPVVVIECAPRVVEVVRESPPIVEVIHASPRVIHVASPRAYGYVEVRRRPTRIHVGARW